MCHSSVAILRTFHNSPKRQRFFELVLDVYISEPHVKKNKSLCKTRWVERHDYLKRFYNLYGYIIACLDAMTNPTGYPNLQKAGVPHDDWCWDTPTRIKTEGPKQSLATSKNILSLIVLLHGLDPLKGVCIKLQKHDADIVTAYRHIDLAIEEVSYMREDFDSVWSEWFGEAESLATDREQ